MSTLEKVLNDDTTNLQSEELLVKRSVGRSYYNPIDYKLLTTGTREQMYEEFEKWKYSSGQCVCVENIPDEMSKQDLEDIFGKHGQIDNFDFIYKDRKVIVRYVIINNFDFVTSIADSYPEPHTVCWDEHNLCCSIHIQADETSDNIIFKFKEKIAQIDQSFTSEINELTDTLLWMNHLLQDSTRCLSQFRLKEKIAQRDQSLPSEIAKLNDNLTWMYNVLQEATRDFTQSKAQMMKQFTDFKTELSAITQSIDECDSE